MLPVNCSLAEVVTRNTAPLRFNCLKSETVHSAVPLLHRRQKKNMRDAFWIPRRYTMLLNYCPECVLFCCDVEILLTYHREAWDSILNKQCYPVSQNGTLITLCVARIEFFLKCDICTEPISVKAKWRKELFINHSLTLLLHYPELSFSQPLSVSHQSSIIPVKAVWTVG